MINRTPARDRPGAVGRRRGSWYRRSRVMLVEGRDLSSRRTQYVVRDLEIGEPINSEECSETAEGVARESEGRSQLSFLRPVRQDQPRGHPGPRLCPVPLQQGHARVWMDRILRTSRRMECSDGLANWRLRSGRKLIDRIQSEECSYRRPTANFGRWASRPCVIGSA